MSIRDRLNWTSRALVTAKVQPSPPTMRRYFIHPESTSAWFEDDVPDEPYRDPLVEEVDREQFLEACAAWGIDPEEEC